MAGGTGGHCFLVMERLSFFLNHKDDDDTSNNPTNQHVSFISKVGCHQVESHLLDPHGEDGSKDSIRILKQMMVKISLEKLAKAYKVLYVSYLEPAVFLSME